MPRVRRALVGFDRCRECVARPSPPRTLMDTILSCESAGPQGLRARGSVSNPRWRCGYLGLRCRASQLLGTIRATFKTGQGLRPAIQVFEERGRNARGCSGQQEIALGSTELDRRINGEP